MSKYIDFVLIHYPDDEKTHLVVAPAWSEIKEGNDVIVEDKYTAGVLAVTTMSTETEQENILIKACGDRLPLRKVTALIQYKKFKYEEGEQNG